MATTSEDVWRLLAELATAQAELTAAQKETDLLLKEVSQQFNIIPERVPSYSTIRRVMMGVEWQSLLKMFNEWALQEYGQRDDINWLGIDGKSLKNTRKNPKPLRESAT